MQRRDFLAASAAAIATPLSALAQSWPEQPIRWVVPYPAGGGTDVIARTLAEAMRPALGQQVLVDNRPGAATNIGGDLVAHAKPDGTTVLSADNAILAFNEHLFRKLPFQPEKDFSYLGAIGRFPLALVGLTTMSTCASSTARATPTSTCRRARLRPCSTTSAAA